MDEVFEQTLSVAPLTEAALFAEIQSSLDRFKTARDANWQGDDARGGQLHSALKAAPEATKKPTAAQPDTPADEAKPQSAGFFAAASEAAGGGRRGADFARALQRWLVGYVDSLALDEVEMMAMAAK